MRKTKSASVSTSLVDRALIERVRRPLTLRPLPIDGVLERAAITLDDLAALCALAEDVLVAREALQWYALTPGTRETRAAALQRILSHVTPEEP